MICSVKNIRVWLIASLILLAAVNARADSVTYALVLLQPLTPTTSALINLVTSKYEIGGNGFHDGLFLSGRISPVISGIGMVFKNGFEQE